MRWEELNSDLFPQTVETVQGVCLLPFGCLERHAHHLPLGTDLYIARELCRRAAELEPAIIFPDFLFTQILEARHYPGAIGIDGQLILTLMDNLCREIARNGLKKIVIVNAHGGNINLLHFFAQIQLESPRDYVVYVAEPRLSPEDESRLKTLWQSDVDGHAGEQETSAILCIRPDLVHREALRDDQEGLPLKRLQTLRDASVSTGIWWYADHPTHYCGTGQPATTEKGEQMLAAYARALAKAIRAIKADQVSSQLQAEFFAAVQTGQRK
jgi:creatinine amidohydrolase